MRVKTKISVLLIAALLSLLFVSCQAEVLSLEKADVKKDPIIESNELVEATVAIDEPKAVVVTVPDEVEKYQYRAIPLFSVEATEGDGKIFGEQRTWRTFETDEDGKLANMGWYRQGYWRFEIRTLNKNNQVLMTGSTKETGDVYLQKGKDNIIRITLHTDDGDGREGQNNNTGKIKFAFETNWLSDSLTEQYIRIEVDKFTTDGQIDINAGRHDTMFPLKGGTEESRVWGSGALDSYDTSGDTWEDPNGETQKAIYGYSDAWTTILQNETDPGLLSQTEGFTAVVMDGRIRFYAETSDLIEGTTTSYDEEGGAVEVKTYSGGISPGSYLVRVKVCTIDALTGKEIVLGGQTMAVKVVGGETTTVIGSLLQEKYIETGLSVTIPDDVQGSIVASSTGEDAYKIVSDNLGSSSLTLTFTPSKAINEAQLSYSWRVNGNIISGANSKTFSFTPTTYGDHKITCVVRGQAGDTGYLGEISSSTVVIRVIEATGPNI